MFPELAGISASPHIALTFDDGPDPASTPAILDLLREHDRLATFFLLGSQVEEHPDVVRRMVNEGHELAVHGWTHRATTLMSPSRLVRDLTIARDAVQAISGAPPRWYRPPYGIFSADAYLTPQRLGMTPVLWSAWGRDWEGGATPARIVRSLQKTLAPGGTVLLHDTDLHAHPSGDWHNTYQAVADLLSGPLQFADVGPLRDHWPAA